MAHARYPIENKNYHWELYNDPQTLKGYECWASYQGKDDLNLELNQVEREI